jgi:Cysteine rich repeat
MRKSLLALTLLSISVSSNAAFAQQQRGGTAEEQKACTRDAQKFCRPVLDQGDFTVLACLKENRAKISAACNQVLKSNGQ